MPNPQIGQRFRGQIWSVVLYVAVCLWIFYVFHNYLPNLDYSAVQTTIYQMGTVVVRWGVMDIPLVLWLWTAAYVLGKKFTQALGIPLDEGAERVWVCSASGLSLLSLELFLLGALQVLYTSVAYALLVLPVAIWFGEVREFAADWKQLRVWRPSVRSAAPSVAYLFVLAYAGIVLSVILLSALGPEIEYDPLIVHLLAAKTFVREHGLKAIPDIPQTFFPKNITLLFNLGMLLHNEITAKLINFLLGLLAILGAYAAAARLYSRSAGMVAVAVLIASPLLLWEMRTAHLDCGFTLYVFLSLYATVRWLQNAQRPWFWLAVYLTAFSLGTRYQALFSLGSLSALVFLYRLTEQRSLSLAGRQATKFFLLSLLGLLPWGVVNWVHAGNPLFPFLNDFFQSPYWTPGQTETGLSQMRESAVQITTGNWWAVVTAFWEITLDQTGRFHGNIGPFYLMLIPLVIFQRKIQPATKIILSFSLFYWIFWLFTGQHLRYYLGAVPGLAVVAGSATVGWLETVQTRTHKALAWAAATVLALMVVVNSPFFEAQGAYSQYGQKVLETLPLNYLVGQESRDKYLTRHVMDYPLVQHLNRLPGQKKVLFWWTDAAPGGFYLEGQAAFVFSRFFHELFTDDPEQNRRILRDNGVTHVVVGQLPQEVNLLSNPEGPFVQRYLKKMYQDNGMILYEFSYEPLAQEVVVYDFLSHLDDSRITMPNGRPGARNSEYRSVETVAEVRRHALRTHPPAEVEFRLTLPKNPLLRFAIGRKFPPCTTNGSFQISVVDTAGERREVFRKNIRAQSELHEVGWFEEQLDLGAYASQLVSIIFQSGDDERMGCDWFLWADPVIVNPPESSQREP